MPYGGADYSDCTLYSDLAFCTEGNVDNAHEMSFLSFVQLRVVNRFQYLLKNS